MAQLNVSPPSLPAAEDKYERQYFDKFSNVLRLFFNQLSNPGPIGATSLNLDLNTLPTDADYAQLRDGDVYRDRYDPVNGLKIKAPRTLLGVSATGSVGTVGVTISKALTGVAAAGATGTVTP